MALDEKEKKKIVGWRTIYDELLMKTIKIELIRQQNMTEGLMHIIICPINPLECGGFGRNVV